MTTLPRVCAYVFKVHHAFPGAYQNSSLAFTTDVYHVWYRRVKLALQPSLGDNTSLLPA
jgi:hypothetical protein